MTGPTQLEFVQIIATAVSPLDGVEVGVCEDGTPIVSGRGLANLCGVQHSSIIRQADAWEAGPGRTSKFGNLVQAYGYKDPCLYIQTKDKNSYPEKVCMAALEYYAFSAGEHCTEVAKRKFREMARATFRAYVYSIVGYRSDTADDWRHFHERLLMNPVPTGFFSVLRESAEFQLSAMRAGLKVDHRTVPDISIGIAWSKHWESTNCEDNHGPRMRHVHFYPADSPQSRSNPQEIHVYPNDALAEFRDWLIREYVANKLPAYLKSKVKDGTLTEGRANKLLAAISVTAPAPLPPAKRLLPPKRLTR